MEELRAFKSLVSRNLPFKGYVMNFAINMLLQTICVAAVVVKLQKTYSLLGFKREKYS